MLQIELVERTCPCGQRFRVSSKSKQLYHSANCEEIPWEERRKVLKRDGLKTVPANVKSITKTKSSGPSVLSETDSDKPKNGQPTSKQIGDTMKEIEVIETTSDNSGPSRTVSESERQEDSGTKQLVPSGQKQLPKLGVSRRRCAAAASTSVSMLNRSANRLLTMMHECVSDTDLERSKDGAARASLERIEMAIRCGEAIAQSVHSQAVLVKAVADLVKVGT